MSRREMQKKKKFSKKKPGWLLSIMYFECKGQKSLVSTRCYRSGWNLSNTEATLNTFTSSSATLYKFQTPSLSNYSITFQVITMLCILSGRRNWICLVRIKKESCKQLPCQVQNDMNDNNKRWTPVELQTVYWSLSSVNRWPLKDSLSCFAIIQTLMSMKWTSVLFSVPSS